MVDHLGQRLGNYRLIRLVGQGGFANVYLGEHIHLNTQAAIKVLQMRLIGSDTEQFRNEARTIANLVHPNIVRILDFGMEDSIPFLVMDYAPNGTLRQNHPKGVPLSLDAIVSYSKQIASALQYAHDQKLIHRDIKPENILLGRNNEVLLSDFGLVIIAQNTSSRSTKELAGTAPYMAPEQFQGKPRAASDQYSLGIVIYEWLSGNRPFNGTFIEIASQHILAPPPLLNGKIPGVSPAIEEVVFTALAKEPMQRFASVQVFATALEQAIQRVQPDLFAASNMTVLSSESMQSTYVNPSPGQSAQLVYTGPLLDKSSQPITINILSGQKSQASYAVPLASQSSPTRISTWNRGKEPLSLRQLQPSQRKNTMRRFVIAALCLIIGAPILFFVYFIAIGLPNHASMTNTGTSNGTRRVSSPVTASPSPMGSPSPIATIFPGQQYINNAQMSSVRPSASQPALPATTFKVHQTFYVVFNINSGGHAGAVCMMWYLNGKLALHFAFPVGANMTASYSQTMFDSPGSGYAELYWASSKACTDQVLAQHVDFTVTQ